MRTRNNNGHDILNSLSQSIKDHAEAAQERKLVVHDQLSQLQAESTAIGNVERLVNSLG